MEYDEENDGMVGSDGECFEHELMAMVMCTCQASYGMVKKRINIQHSNDTGSIQQYCGDIITFFFFFLKNCCTTSSDIFLLIG